MTPAQDAVDAEPGVPEAGVVSALSASLRAGPRSPSTPPGIAVVTRPDLAVRCVSCRGTLLVATPH